MSNRAFGVEIECYLPEDMYRHVCNCDFCSEEYDDVDAVDSADNFLADNNFHSWVGLTTHDDSLDSADYGVEIKSPILVGLEGFAELEKVFAALNRAGFWVDQSCGMHVHHDARDFVEDFELQKRLVESWMENQNLIDNMVAPWRVGNGHCESWDDYDFHDFVNQSGSGPRGSLNMQNLHYRDIDTIEIRQHEGTLNYEEAESWIKFGQSFLDSIAGRKSPLPKMTDEELLLKRIKVAKNASRFLTTKARLNKERGY